MSSEVLTAILALVGGVIIVAALLSGAVDKSGLPQVAVFLGLGAILGPAGLKLVNLDLDAPAIRVVATLSLVLVLFTDAISLDLKEVRRHARLTFLIIGPGTLLTAGLIGLTGWGLLGLAPAAAVILGASLASSDPVLLRNLLRRREVPDSARQALRLESGMGDVVLLPIVLVAMGFLGYGSSGEAQEATNWGKLFIDLFLLGPGAGVAVGVLSVATLDLVRRRIGIRRDYESLYSLGVAFAAYAAAESLHGSGFLAAFAAGLTISALDVEMCDCFLEYGETTAEMALLFAFVLFGTSIIWSGFELLTLTMVAFAVLVMLIRPVALFLALGWLKLDRFSLILIGWFGPRGLSTLLLVLLPVFEGLPGSKQLFQICCLVVLLSVVLHGFSPMFLGRFNKGKGKEKGSPAKSGGVPVIAPVVIIPPARIAPITLEIPRPKPRPETANASDGGEPAPPGIRVTDAIRISIEEYQNLVEAGAPVVVLDVRTERSFGGSEAQASRAIRLLPDNVVERATELGLPKNSWLIAYCG